MAVATIAAIAGGIAVVGGIAGAMAGNKAAARQRDAVREAVHNLNAKSINKLLTKLLPIYRSGFSAQGGSYQEHLRGALADAGLLGSPVGIAISDAAAGAGDTEAFHKALTDALSIRQQQSSLMAGQTFKPRTNPVLGGLTAGANAYFGASMLGPKSQPGGSTAGFQPPAGFQTPGTSPTAMTPPQKFPNLYPAGEGY